MCIHYSSATTCNTTRVGYESEQDRMRKADNLFYTLRSRVSYFPSNDYVVIIGVNGERRKGQPVPGSRGVRLLDLTPTATHHFSTRRHTLNT
jgi:hypothetical protein